MMTREALLRAIKEAKENTERLRNECKVKAGDDSTAIHAKWLATNEYSKAVERYSTLVDVLCWHDDES